MLPADNHAKSRVGGLSKPEWLVVFGSAFLIIAGASSLTIFYTGDVFWIFCELACLSDNRGDLCVFGGIKPQSDGCRSLHRSSLEQLARELLPHIHDFRKFDIRG